MAENITLVPELRLQLFALDSKRTVALGLVASELKWLNSRWRLLQEDGLDGLIPHAANEVDLVAHHAHALHVLLAQIDALNVAVETVVKIGNATGVDVAEELRLFLGSAEPVAVTVNALGKPLNAREV